MLITLSLKHGWFEIYGKKLQGPIDIERVEHTPYTSTVTLCKAQILVAFCPKRHLSSHELVEVPA